MAEKLTRREVVDRLVALIERLNPYLDINGCAFCQMPHEEEGKRIHLSLRKLAVRSLLTYRYHAEHLEYPGKERIHEAIEYVEGKLLEFRRGSVIVKDCPVLRCFLRAAHEQESGSGRAQEILNMLRETQKAHRVRGRAELLPINATAMGIWMVDNQSTLQAHGIEVTRGQKSRRRFWDWRRIIRDGDTYDTSSAEVSQEASLPNSKEGNENQQNDTLTDEKLAELLPKEALS